MWHNILFYGYRGRYVRAVDIAKAGQTPATALSFELRIRATEEPIIMHTSQLLFFNMRGNKSYYQVSLCC
jgi:hypothetical protein